MDQEFYSCFEKLAPKMSPDLIRLVNQTQPDRRAEIDMIKRKTEEEFFPKFISRGHLCDKTINRFRRSLGRYVEEDREVPEEERAFHEMEIDSLKVYFCLLTLFLPQETRRTSEKSFELIRVLSEKSKIQMMRLMRSGTQTQILKSLVIFEEISRIQQYSTLLIGR